MLTRGNSQKESKSYAGKAVLGLKLFSRSSIVINQSKARALATTELMVETIDLQRNLKGGRESSTGRRRFLSQTKAKFQSSKNHEKGFDDTKKPYHDAGLLDLVHLGNLLGHFGLGHVSLSGMDNVDALISMSQNRQKPEHQSNGNSIPLQNVLKIETLERMLLHAQRNGHVPFACASKACWS